MSDKLPKAIVTGVLQIGDARIPCAVLDDAENTRVLTQAGFLAALGRSRTPKSGQNEAVANLPAFLRAKNLEPFISNDLVRSSAPIIFGTEKGGGLAGNKGFGYRATLLPEICWVYHDARKAGKLLPSQAHVADYCDALLRGLTNVAIDALIDEATGFQDIRMRNALQKLLEKYVTRELQPWIKTFGDDFYKQIFRLNDWPYDPSSVKRPSVIGKWTNDIIYDRLAPAVKDELHKLTERDEHGRLKNKLFQHLTPDTGHPALKAHLGAVEALMRASADWGRFRRLLQRAFPKIGTNLELAFAEPEDDR